MKRIVIIGVIIFVVLLGGFFLNKRSQSAATSAIQTAAVRRTDFVKSVSSSGKTSASKSVDLKFQTSGKLAWVGVKEGDMVNAYQTIASMDAREVQKNLEKALRAYSSERSDFEQEKQFEFQGRTPEQALNDTMRRILEKNQWDLELAVLDVELKYLAVEYASLVTPIAGIVTHVDTPVAGINITPATAVFAVADPNSLVFEAKVDEVDVGSLVVGQAATLALDAFPDATFSGKISYVSYTSETSAGGATVFPVKISFDQPQRLRIGLNGDVTIQTHKEEGVMIIPTASIREEEGTKYVYRQTGNTYEQVEIKVGAQNDDDTIVTSGLTDGDMVVTKGFSSIPKGK